MSVVRAIEHANSIIPGIPVESGEDPRWQAIIQIGYYIESNPDAIWSFVVDWGGHELEDLRDAIACVLLEHLLEYHFDLIFPRVREMVQQEPFVCGYVLPVLEIRAVRISPQCQAI